MVGIAIDYMSNPLGTVRQLFSQACANGGTIGQAPSEFGEREFFQQKLQGGAVDTLPELSSACLDLLPPNCLVRFRGMIQDMFDPEFYVGAFKEEAGNAASTWQTTKYLDAPDLPSGRLADETLWKRNLLYCVPVPGESQWSRQLAARTSASLPPMNNGVAADTRGKRRRGGEDDEGGMVVKGGGEEEAGVMEAGAHLSSPGDTSKRQRESRDHPPPGAAGQPTPSSAPSNSASHLGAPAGGAPVSPLNLPLPAPGQRPCLVKVYDGLDSSLKLNDVVEFVGVLTHDPGLTLYTARPNLGPNGDHRDCVMGPTEDPMVVAGEPPVEEEFGMSVSDRLPASQVPRLHCIFLKKLSAPHPTVPLAGSAQEAALLDDLRPHVAHLRGSLLAHLMSVLGGDALAAEYLLLHMLSRVRGWIDPIAAGKLSINFTKCPPSSEAEAGTSCSLGALISDAMGALVPRCHLLPLSIKALNAAVLTPRKDYGTNRLVTGSLQLASGTHLILDETTLTTGQLDATGVRNVQALKDLTEWQKVAYDFEYHKMDMEADVPIVVLSQGKSLLPADILLPLNITSTPVLPTVDGALLDQWRLYLAMARQLEHTIDPQVSQAIQEDIVAARREDPSLEPEAFHRWLTTARLVSLSFGETTLSSLRWQAMRDMEHRRLERVRCT